jgi:hypothetical protein
VRCRRDHRNLTPAERARFVAGLYHLKATGVIDQFADLHRDHFSHGHNNSSFLPWHREFIRLFEQQLQTFDPRIMLPYWNSSDDQSTSSSLWANDFLGQFDSAWGLGRTLGAGGALASPGTVDGALNEPTYDVFWPDLESNVHNGPHGWVGGEMSTASSPHDPAFFLHHCFMDTCWAQWQLRHPGAAFIPSAGAPGLNDHLHPWMTTPADVLDHRTINIYSFPPAWTEDAPRVTPPTATPPTVSFHAVPSGLTFLRPAIFDLDACESLTFNIGTPVLDTGPAGTTFTRISAATQVFDPHVDSKARLWFAYTGTAANDVASGHVDVHCVETGDSWTVPIVADVIARPSAAIALVLDQSNSMNFDSGIAPGVHRSDVLRFSAPPAVDVLDANNAMLVMSFDQDPHSLIGLTPADTTGRLQLNGAIANYNPNPNGWTAIGEALQYAHDQLDPVTNYDIKATVLLTDGQENHGPYTRLSIGDVTTINERCYAIGLGTPANIDPGALMALCQGHQGYMLITGDLNQDTLFRLAKYYQQIISGVTNQDIVLDPEGFVYAGQLVRIPFWITETDITARAVLLTPTPTILRFALETPTGDVIIPGSANPMVEFRVGSAVEVYRVSLPLPIGANQAHAGLWHALIGIGGRRAGLEVASHLKSFAASAASARYSLSVHTYSNLRMRASLTQSGNEPGATLYLSATLTEYDIPPTSPARVRAELVRPDDTSSVLWFQDRGAGTYETSCPATQAGVYRFRIIAEGTTMRSRPFTREQTLTGAVWAGGDRPPRPPRSPDDRWCHLIDCLLAQKSIQALLERLQVDPREVAHCLRGLCRRPRPAADAGMRLRDLLKDDRALQVLTEALQRLEEPHD